MENKLLNQIDYSKSAVADVSCEIIKGLQEGTLTPLDVALRFKAMKSVIEQVKGVLDPMARADAERYGEKSFVFGNAKIDLAEVGTKYDFSNCGDAEYNRLAAELKALEIKVAEREKFLKAIKVSIVVVDEVSGEISKVFAPIKTSTSSIKITL